MPDATYDVVIVGGGTNGLSLACYLTKFTNLSVVVFEERHELAAGWSTEEGPAPGFMANLCSHEMWYGYDYLFQEDFPEWEEYGARFVDPDVTTGVVFLEDDTCLLQYHRSVDPTQERTAKEIARFSEKDAETYLRLYEKCMKYWFPAMNESWWSPAVMPPFDPVSKMAMNPDSGFSPSWRFDNAVKVYGELFESPEVRHGMLRCQQRLGAIVDEPGSAFITLPQLFTGTTVRYVVGGTHAKAHACNRIISANGGKTITQTPVDRAIIENGKCTGVRLKDGSEVSARKAVICTFSPRSFIYDFLGPEHVTARIRRKIDCLETKRIAIAWYTWAFQEPAQYRAAAWNPDVDKVAWGVLGTKEIDSHVKSQHSRLAGIWPDPLNNLEVSHFSINDPKQYPEGGPTTYLTEYFVLPANVMNDKEWKYYEKFHAEQIINHWEKYAPNMNWDNAIGYIPVTPQHSALHSPRSFGPTGNWSILDNTASQLGVMRPIPEWSGRKVGIENLYGAGVGWHPSSASGTCGGYVTYKIMAEDLGLPRFWEDKGRPW